MSSWTAGAKCRTIWTKCLWGTHNYNKNDAPIFQTKENKARTSTANVFKLNNLFIIMTDTFKYYFYSCDCQALIISQISLFLYTHFCLVSIMNSLLHDDYCLLTLFLTTIRIKLYSIALFWAIIAM